MKSVDVPLSDFTIKKHGPVRTIKTCTSLQLTKTTVQRNATVLGQYPFISPVYININSIECAMAWICIASEY